VKRTLFLIPVIFFVFLETSFADKLYLKNGRSLEGLIREESDSRVELDVGFGTVTFEKSAIERLEKSNPEETAIILKHWASERAKSELMRAKAEEEWNKSLAEWKEKQSRQAAQEEADADAGPKEVALAREMGHMRADVVLNKKVNASLLVDTGASLVIITKATADRLRLDTNKEGTPIQLQVADGRKIDARYVVLASIKIGDVEAKNVETAVLMDTKQDFGFKDGLLGMSFLRRFNFKFDYNSNKLILERLK
jgi:clan AA aspartic protease (TIGR02281 family)